MRTLGILGGMGPEAAIDLQHKILRCTPARCDQEHLPVITWNVPQLHDRIAAIFGRGPSPLDALRAGVLGLERAGAEVLVIACNTAHHWHAELQSEVSIPVLHIADAVYNQIREMNMRVPPLGLLATTGTLHSGFYQRRLASHQVELRLPTNDEQEELSRAIAQIKSGRHETAAHAIAALVESLCARGAQRIILGCTELPLVASEMLVASQCIDATEALARQAVQACLDPR